MLITENLPYSVYKDEEEEHLYHMEGPKIEKMLGYTNLDSEKGYCTLSIHMKNNSVKNRGFGTQAEILALEYAFGSLGMETVFADAVHKNKRSQHVLEKVGFH